MIPSKFLKFPHNTKRKNWKTIITRFEASNNINNPRIACKNEIITKNFEVGRVESKKNTPK